MFKKKAPTTVAEVYNESVANLKKIQEVQEAKAKKAAEEREELDAKYKAECEANDAAKQAADKEIKDADVVIVNFGTLFNQKGD